MEEESQAQMEPEGLESLDEDIQGSVNDLLWLGRLEEVFEYHGNRFSLSTLNGEEELLAGLVMKDYMDTLGQIKAYAWALVAISLTSVNDDPDFCPQVTPDKRAYARARFQYCIANWYWPVGQFLYGCYQDLVKQQEQALAEMEDLSEGSLHTFTPFAGSSTDKGSSAPQETAMDYLDSEPEDSTPSD